MKILIQDPQENKNIRLFIPNGLLINRLSIAIMMQALKDQDIPFDKEQLKPILQELKNCVKTFGHFDLVDIETSDGEKVLIRL